MTHSGTHAATRGDFSADRRLLRLSALALVIGAVGAVVARLLVQLIRFFTNLFFFGRLGFSERSPAANHLGLWVILIPVAGSLLIGLMARFGSEKIRGHGIPEALEAILFGKSLMNPRVAILKPLSSAISIGSGGPFGAEGPIIMTGGAFGSLFAQAFHLTDAERKTLLVAGAAAGMTAIFGTPLAAVLLAIELLLFEWRPRSLVPVAVACAVAFGLRGLFFATGPLFPLPASAPLPPLGLLWAAGVGLLAGLFATLISKGLYRLEDGFAKLPLHWMWWPALGGLIVGIGGYFEPRALGVGYDVISDLLHGQLGPADTLRLVGVKAVIWVFALASGTSGGVLAPLLIVGAGLGAAEATLIPVGNPSVWALISMAAILGGMMRSPFMACLFALELTRDVDSVPAVFVGVIVAYAFTVLTMKRSILTEKVARRGYDLFREYAVDPLERVRVGEAMSREVETIPADARPEELTELFGRRKRRGYPVVDERGCLFGMVTASDLLLGAHGEAEPDPECTAASLARRPVIVATPDEPCRRAADRMANHGIGRLPVVDPRDPTRILGILTRSDLLKARSRAHEEETKVEQFLVPPFSLQRPGPRTR